MATALLVVGLVLAAVGALVYLSTPIRSPVVHRRLLHVFRQLVERVVTVEHRQEEIAVAAVLAVGVVGVG